MKLMTWLLMRSLVTISCACALVVAVHETFKCKKVDAKYGSHCKEWAEKRLDKIMSKNKAECEEHCRTSFECHDYSYQKDTQMCRLFGEKCTTHTEDRQRVFYRCTRTIIHDESPCQADVGLIIDSSYSIGGLNGRKDNSGWEVEKRFVKALAADFKTEDHDDGIRMSVADISENAFMHIKFNEFLDYDRFDSLVDNVTYQGSNTMLDKALELAEKDMFTVESGIRGGDVKKVLIFLTDGARRKHHTKITLEKQAHTLRRIRHSGVHIIAIGIPDLKGHVDKDGLVKIAGLEEHAHVRDYLYMIVEREFIDKIVNETCGGMPVYPTEAITTVPPIMPTTETFTAPPECEGLVADIGFIIDSSYSIGGYDGQGPDGLAWRQEKEFVDRFAKALRLDEVGVRMSVIDFSEDALLLIKFKQYFETKDFVRHLDTIAYQGSNTRMDLALKVARSHMFVEENGCRLAENIPRILIFITDGSQSYRRLVRKEVNPLPFAEQLRNDGVKIITIGVPDKYGRIDEEELFGIAGYRENMFTKLTFDQILTEEFLRTITKASCESKSSYVDTTE